MAQTVFDKMRAKERRETLQEAVQQVILARFPQVPAGLLDRVEQQRNVRALEALLRQAILAEDLAEVEAQLPR